LDISVSSSSGQLAPPSPNAGMPNSPPAPGPSQLNIEIGLLLSYMNVESVCVHYLFLCSFTVSVMNPKHKSHLKPVLHMDDGTISI